MSRPHSPKPPAAARERLDRLASSEWLAAADPLEALETLKSCAKPLREWEDVLVIAARRQGRTWAQIGAAYGVGRQAAFNRFGHLEGVSR